MKNKIKNQKGFSLMEVLVSTSIFVIISLASMSIYIAVLRASQETKAMTRIQQESQLIIETLTKKIKTSRVDYDYVGYVGGIDNINGEIELALIDSLDDEYVFTATDNSLTIAVNGGEGISIPASNVNIESLKFFINPTTNPFSLDAPPSSQPYVTLVMEISSSKGTQQANLIVQQTVPQRSAGVFHKDQLVF